MKRVKYIFLASVAVLTLACGSKTDLVNDPNIEHHKKTPTPADWRTVNTNSFFTVDIPNYMEATGELNESASCQYAFVEEIDSVVQECYMIVIMETKEQIESYDLGESYDALSYGNISIENLQGGLSSFDVLTKEPKIAEVNGIACVEYDMEGYLNDLGVFYHMGVFEGEKAFYQVLTWTLLDQRAIFEKDMTQIVYSFEEKK